MNGGKRTQLARSGLGHPLRILTPVFLLSLVCTFAATDNVLELATDGSSHLLSVRGGSDEWRFQISNDLLSWTNAPDLGTLFSSKENPAAAPLDTKTANRRFLRALKSDGLFDPNLLRTIDLTFTNSNWTTLLI